MRVSLRTEPRAPLPPQVRALEPWRDGRQLAALIEATFSQEEIGFVGSRMIELLRNYGQYEPMAFGLGSSFVWVEGGRLIGNASIQRNPAHRGVWIIGNVATDPAYRRRGVAQAVVEACVRYAMAHGARFVALLVDQENTVAQSLYGKFGFEPLGVTTYYLRTSLHEQPPVSAPLALDLFVRSARWSDRRAIWNLARMNIPDELTYAEPFDAGLYKLGVWWSTRNFLLGEPEQWQVLQRASSDVVLGAVRSHISREGPHHHIELMLDDAVKNEFGEFLLDAALQRFAPLAAMPISAAQSWPHEAARAALMRAGFRPQRSLIHMRRHV